MREALIQKARQKTVVGYLMSLGHKGVLKNGRWFSRSPLRDESTASFGVSLEKNLWYDYGLGVGGDLIDLVMRLNGCDFPHAVRIIEGLDLAGADDVVLSKAPVSSPEESTTVPPDTGQSKAGRRTVEKYFKACKLPFYPEIEAFPMSYKRNNYIGFPVSNPAERSGIECRGFEITSNGITPCHRRMTLGKKLPWIFRRDPERYLVTESITDSLAGEVILTDATLSLVALDGVGNVKRLPDYIPAGSKVLLAMDNDGEDNGCIGQKMQAEAARLLVEQRCHIEYVTKHIEAGVKDLFRLLHK